MKHYSRITTNVLGTWHFVAFGDISFKNFIMNSLFYEKNWKETHLYLPQIKKNMVIYTYEQIFVEWLFCWLESTLKNNKHFSHIFLPRIYICISYFDLTYISHFFILLPAVESEQWEDCFLSSEAESDSEDVNLN